MTDQNMGRGVLSDSVYYTLFVCKQTSSNISLKREVKLLVLYAYDRQLLFKNVPIFLQFSLTSSKC